jgi:hypothetical protein
MDRSRSNPMNSAADHSAVAASSVAILAKAKKAKGG